MGFKMKGFTPFTKPYVLPEVKLTAKRTFKDKVRNVFRTKKHSTSNPVIKSVHSSTNKAAKNIGKVGVAGAHLYSGGALFNIAHKFHKAKKIFNLKKYKTPVVEKIKTTTKTIAPVVTDDVLLGVIPKESKKKKK